MKVMRLNIGNAADAAARAAETLRSGGIVLYPTDTLYGLGADAFSEEAVAKLYSIKQRNEKKPLHAIVADIAMAEKYSEVGNAARSLVEKLGGKITVIVKKNSAFNSGICRNVTTFGFRIPDNAFCIAMLKEFDAPITATSANKSDAPTSRRIDAILAQLGSRASGIDLVVDTGELPERQPSSVVDLSGEEQKILREAAVSTLEIQGVLSQNRQVDT